MSNVRKIGRNQPCPCGSGRKYKKCHLPKEEGVRIMNNEPKNTFREEVKKETVSEQVMLERDQKIAYLRFKNQVEMQQADCRHLQEAISKLKAFGNEIFQLPDSEGRAAILEENKKHIEQLEKQLEASRANRAQEVMLSVLEEKFGEAINDEPSELKDD